VFSLVGDAVLKAVDTLIDITYGQKVGLGAWALGMGENGIEGIVVSRLDDARETLRGLGELLEMPSVAAWLEEEGLDTAITWKDLGGVWTLALWVISLHPGFIARWDEHWFGYYGRAGSLYFLLPVTHLFVLTITCRSLWVEFRLSRDYLRRSQVVWLLAAHLVFGVLCLDNFGPLYGGGRLPLGNLATVLYFVIIAVTIARFRFLDVQAVFRYGLLYTSLTFVLSGLYFLGILGLQDWFRLEVFSGSAVLPMVPALGLAFAVGPIKNSLQQRIDRRFFRCRIMMSRLF
jgi:hypothetical protein